MQYQIYICNIQMKHLQYTSEIHEIYSYNICSSTCCPQWTLVDAELDAGTELDATARGSNLDCAQRESGREAQGAAERSTRRGRR